MADWQRKIRRAKENQKNCDNDDPGFDYDWKSKE
jgi:hypothetical protein